MIGKLSTVAVLAGLVSAGPINLSRSPSNGFSNSFGGSSFGNSFSNLFGNSFSNSFSNLNFEEINFVDFSFNNFDNFNSFNSFDNFFGQSNFLGQSNEIVVIDIEQPTCRSIDINVIQQQLAILSETVKQVFVSEFCDVELQVIVLEQFLGRFDSFSRSLRRENNFSPSYDSSVSALITEIVINGNLNTNNFGFNGNSIGSNSVIFSGNNWGGNSINSVGLAYQLSHQSRIASLGSVSNSVNLGSNSQSSSQLSNINSQSSSQLSNISSSSQLSNDSSSQLSNDSSTIDPNAVASAAPPVASLDSNATAAAPPSDNANGTAAEVTANGSGFK